jgi:SecD/SecF fusion protein
VARVVRVIDRRLNAGEEIRAWARVPVRAVGENRVEVDIPSRDEAFVNQVRELVTRPGTLEFRILANSRDHASLIRLARSQAASEVTDDRGRSLARWVPVVNPIDFQQPSGAVTRAVVRDGRKVFEILVVIDQYNVTGAYLRGAAAGMEESGRLEIHFSLLPTGAALFKRLTSENLPDPNDPKFKRRLGILIDGRLHSAPNLLSPIFDRARIDGQFTSQEVDVTVRLLNTEPLPAALREVK